MVVREQVRSSERSLASERDTPAPTCLVVRVEIAAGSSAEQRVARTIESAKLTVTEADCNLRPKPLTIFDN